MAVLSAVLLLSLLSVSSSFPVVYPVVPTTDDSNETHLYLALMMSFGFGGAFNSSGTVPGIQIALDLINNQTDILPGYKLHYILMDSQCNRNVALDTLFKQLISDVTRVGIIGAGCSVATEPTAEISHYYNITQLSCASSSHSLANRDKYRAYFQMLPSAVNLVPAIGAVCMQYGWRHVAIIGQEENLFQETINRLITLFDNESITWNLRTFRSSDGPLSLGNNLFEERARIFFLAMYPGNARTVICEAYKTSRIYPRYSFIIYGWYSPNWWIPTTAHGLDCTREQIESVLHYSIAVLQHQFGTNSTQVTKAGISYTDYDALYQRRISQLGYNYSTHNIQCFDGVWAFVLALNQTIAELSENSTLNALAKEIEGLNTSSPMRIEDATYKNNIIQQTMFKYLERTDFLGVSGEVSFTDLGIRNVNRLRVFQYRYTNSGVFDVIEFGSVDLSVNSSSLQYYTNESDSTVWPGLIPYDGKAKNETASVALPVAVINSTLAITGILFGIFCLAFIILYRKHKLVRLASPNLNVMVIIGAIVMYCSAFLYSFPVFTMLGNTILCNIQPRLFSFGYTLCFGTILAKMWRVYYIFTNPKPNRKAVKDWHLAVFVLTAVLIDGLLLLGLLTAFEGGRTQATLIRSLENPSDEIGPLGNITDYYTYVCESRDRHIWLGIVFGYKAVLQVAALFLAFGIRKVKVKGLNDSKFVGLTVYISSIILTVQIIVSITLNEYLSVFSAVFGLCILINATVILGLLFFPQMVSVYRDPEGKNVFRNDTQRTTHLTEKTVNTSRTTQDIVDSPFLSDQQKIAALVQKIQELGSIDNPPDIFGKSLIKTSESMDMLEMMKNESGNRSKKKETCESV